MDFGSAPRRPRPDSTSGSRQAVWIGLLGCLATGCFNPDDAPALGDTDTESGGSGSTSITEATASGATTAPETGETTDATDPSGTTSDGTTTSDDASTGDASDSEGSSGSSSTGEPAEPGCGDGIVVATEVCYEVAEELTGSNYRFGYFEDLDSDDDRDLIYSASNGEIVVQLNTDGVFGLATTSAFAGVSTLNQMGFSFIDDDDVLDGFLRSESGGVLYTVFGNTSGDYAIADGDGTEAYALAMGDMNGDEREEAVVLVLSGIEVFSIADDGTMVQTDAVDISDFSDQLDITLADFNGDEQLDVLYLGDYMDGNQVRMVLGNGDGTLNSSPLAPFVTTQDARDLTIGDFDGDGETDIAIADGSTIGVVYGNGGLGFTEADDITVDSGTTSRVEAADVDQDGVDDLVVGYSDRNTLTVYLGNEARGFSAGEDVSLPHVTETLSTGDINGDGVPDIVVTSDAADALTVVRSTN
ncbi:MAG: FG-GAP repeat domain-containing protein [Nannocystales bacterium]